MKSDTDQTPKLPALSAKTDFIATVCLLPVLFGVAYVSDMERGMTAACSVIAIELVIRAFSYLRTKTWFWLVIGLFVVSHVLIVIYLPWAKNNYSAIVLLPIGLVDFGIMYFIVRITERVLR